VKATAGSLLERARQGDATALDELLQWYDPVLVTMAHLLVTSDEVESVVLRTWQAAVHGDGANGTGPPPPVPVREWLVTRLVQECGAVPAGPQPVLDPTGDFLDAAEDDPAADHRWKGAFAKDVKDWGELGVVLDGSAPTRKILGDAIAALPPVPRRALLLRDLAGVPLDRMAEAVGLSTGESLLNLRWARAQVQLALEFHLEPAEDADGVS
jgi:hypothetical protein